MADSSITIDAGADAAVDTRTEGTNSHHRQVVVLGDPATNAGVAPVDVTNGLSVTLTTAVPAGTNNIGDVDVLSVIPGTGATNLGKAVDTATGSTDTGVLALGTRDDALSTLTPAEGDNAQVRLNARGAVWVAIDAAEDGGLIATGTAGTAASEVLTVQGIASMTPVIVTVDGAALTALQLIDNTVAVDDAAYAVGGSGVPAMGRFSDPPDAIDDGDAAVMAITARRALHVNIRDDVGDSCMDGGNNALKVNIVAATAFAFNSDAIKVDDNAFTVAASSVSVGGYLADEASTDSVDEGDAGAARMTLDRKQIVTAQPHTAGGLTIHRSIDLDEGTLEVVKASPGCLYGMWASNTATSTRFIKFYDATSGTYGTGTPVLTIPIPGNSSDDVTGVFNVGGLGITFATGICVGAGTGVADADTGAPGANEVVVNIFYK